MTSIEAINLWCDSLSEYQVRLHNFEHQLPHGDPNSCYYIDQIKLDENRIDNLKLNLYTASIQFNSNQNGWIVVQFIIYTLISLCLLIIVIYHCYFIMYDSIKLICIKHKPNHRISHQLKKIAAIYSEEKNAKSQPILEAEQNQHSIDNKSKPMYVNECVGALSTSCMFFLDPRFQILFACV